MITKTSITLFLLIFLLFPFVTKGGHFEGHTPADSFDNPLGDLTLVDFLEKVLDALVLIAFPIIVLFFLYAAFLFISARGDETKITTAKRIFLWTVIGALLILGAWTLSLAIQGTVDEIRRAGGVSLVPSQLNFAPISASYILFHIQNREKQYEQNGTHGVLGQDFSLGNS